MRVVLDCCSKTLDLTQPVVMGVLNVTPDSFYDGGRYSSIDAQLRRVEQMLEEGASIIDIGAVSSRPGAKPVCEYGEIERLFPSLKAIRHHFPDCIISIDTTRAVVAKTAVEFGADMINDISAGYADEEMFSVIAQLNVPYIVMHMQGSPETMQNDPHYHDVVKEVNDFFADRISQLSTLGFHKVILDPGFGFGKNLQHNFALLNRLETFGKWGMPVMVGFSRKSMIQKVAGVPADRALNGTTVLNTIALLKGAHILRVHDVAEAVEAVRLVTELEKSIRTEHGSISYK